jgi:hypothetical protein
LLQRRAGPRSRPNLERTPCPSLNPTYRTQTRPAQRGLQAQRPCSCGRNQRHLALVWRTSFGFGRTADGRSGAANRACWKDRTARPMGSSSCWSARSLPTHVAPDGPFVEICPVEVFQSERAQVHSPAGLPGDPAEVQALAAVPSIRSPAQ